MLVLVLTFINFFYQFFSNFNFSSNFPSLISFSSHNTLKWFLIVVNLDVANSNISVGVVWCRVPGSNVGIVWTTKNNLFSFLLSLFFCTFCSSFLFFFDMVNLLLDDFLVAVAVSSTSISSVRSSLHFVVAIFHCIGFRSTFQLIFFSRLVPGYVESDMWVHSMAKFSAVRRFPWGRFFLVFGCSHIDIVLSPKSRMVAEVVMFGWRCEGGDGEQLSNMCVMCTEFSWAIELEIWCVRCSSSSIYRFIIKFPLLPLLAWQWNDIRSENAIMMHFFSGVYIFFIDCFGCSSTLFLSRYLLFAVDVLHVLVLVLFCHLMCLDAAAAFSVVVFFFCCCSRRLEIPFFLYVHVFMSISCAAVHLIHVSISHASG